MYPSHAQYEAQFKKWGERKNLSADEWRLVLQLVDQNNDDGKQRHVYRDQKLISPSKLERKRQMYCKRQEGKSSKQFIVQTVTDMYVTSFSELAS